MKFLVRASFALVLFLAPVAVAFADAALKASQNYLSLSTQTAT